MPEPRVPRTRSAAALALAAASAQPAPPPEPEKSTKGHARKTSATTTGIARPRVSVLAKKSRGNIKGDKDKENGSAKETVTPPAPAPAPASQPQPQQSQPSQPSQIPRSAIPRPVTIGSLSSLMKDGAGAPAAPARAIRKTGSATLPRPGSGMVRKGAKAESAGKDKEEVKGKDEVKEVKTEKTEKDKSAKEDKEDKAKVDKPLIGAKRVPLLERVLKEAPASAPRPVSPPKSAAFRALKRRPQSIGSAAEAKTLFGSSKPSSLTVMKVPPRMKLAQDSDVSFGPDSPSPLPGSLAASKSKAKKGTSATPSAAGTPASSLSSAIGAAVAAAVAANAARATPGSSPATSDVSAPRSHARGPSASASRSVSRTHSRAVSLTGTGSIPPSPKLPDSGSSSLALRKPRHLPETPAIRQLIAREREMSRLGDLSGISEADISLASNASFGILTPPVARVQPAATPGGFGFRGKADKDKGKEAETEQEKLQKFTYPHVSNANLQTEIGKLQDERGALEARVASLAAEEERLKTLADRAMRDREDALLAQEEAEARRDVAVWDAVVQSIDEAIEEESALRGTIASLRAVVLAM